VIAEVKRRSPSAGDLAAPGTDVVARARAYAAGGAAIVSVLVEPHWFGGSMADLTAVRAAIPVPVLAKDFVVDERQLPLLRAAGADLALLIAALHRAPALRHLVRVAREVGLEPLVEVHEARELDRALASGARLIGINNRDLRSLSVDPDHAVALRSHVPDDRLVVAESGAVDPGVLSAWRALGFDAALVGEALMRAGTGPDDVRARTAAFVAAGRPPSDAEDIAAADRGPWVKICGVTDPRGVDSVIASGADAIGLNLVEGTPRCLSLPEAAALASRVRATRRSDGGPRVIGVVGDVDPVRAADMAGRIGLDAIQWSGRSPLPAGDLGLPAIAVVRGPVAGHAGDVSAGPDDVPNGATVGVAGRVVADGRAILRRPGVERLILDATHAAVLGGTGSRTSVPLAAAVAREIPVVLAGGLTAANVAQALRTIPAVGVDVASGVEVPPGTRVSPAVRAEPGTRPAGGARPRPRPRKDPFLVGLFVKRARSARLDLPLAPSRPTPIAPGLLDADERGRWGTERQFGGRYVPETLVSALRELEAAWFELRGDPRYWSDLRTLRRDYIGRPSPLYRADRLAAEIERRFRQPAPVPEARGSQPHRRAQDHQRARPGAAHAAARQAPRDRRDRGGSARRRHGHGVRPLGPAMHGLHGAGGHPPAGTERAAHARARR